MSEKKPSYQAHIDKIVAEWPPLTDEQIHKLALLLKPGMLAQAGPAEETKDQWDV